MTSLNNLNIIESTTEGSSKTLFYEPYFDYNICITNFLPFIEHRSTYILLLNRKHKQIFNDKVLERCCFHQQPHGIVEEYYPTYPPRIKKRISYKNGKENGLYESWHKNGQQRLKINYKNGKEEGLYESWYQNGQKEFKVNYASFYTGANSASRRHLRGKLSKNGNEDGLCESWYDETLAGSPRENQSSPPAPHGSPIRLVLHKTHRQQDNKINYASNDTGAKLSKDGNKNGKEYGLCEGWYENGQQQWKKNYKGKQKDGLCEYWYENGQQKYKRNYKNGKKDGQQSFKTNYASNDAGAKLSKDGQYVYIKTYIYTVLLVIMLKMIYV